MLGERYQKKARGILWVLLCLCGVYLAWPITTLQVRSGPEGGVLKMAMALPPDYGVTVGFMQSVYKVVQEERYVIRDGSLRLSSIYFGSLDALNYYDPLELLPRKEIRGGYEVRINPPRVHPVRFATAHSTEMWIKVGDDPPIPLERFAGDADSFFLSVSYWPRVVTRLLEWTHG